MPDLKLIALDTDDLAVMSVHLQDAVVRVADLAFLKSEKRFAALLNRFDWQAATARRRTPLARRRCGLRFERVLCAQVSGFDLADKSAVLSLLAINFEALSLPSGTVTLTFSGGAGVRLEVECIEAEMSDLGAAWQTRARPQHDDQGDGPPTPDRPAKT